MLFSIKKTYLISYNLSSIEDVLNKKIIINNYKYEIHKNTGDTIKFIPKSTEFLLHNAFLPEITAKKSGNKLIIEYSLLRSIKILFAFISFLMIFIEVGLLNTFNYSFDNSFSLWLVPLIYFFQALFTVSGFRISYKVVEKKVSKIIRDNNGQSEAGSMIDTENE